jgi:hypothetical protein
MLRFIKTALLPDTQNAQQSQAEMTRFFMTLMASFVFALTYIT